MNKINLSVKKYFRHRTLRQRISLAMLLVSLLSLLIMAYQGYHCARIAVIDSVYAHLDTVIQTRAASIEAWITAQKQDIRLFADILATADTPKTKTNPKILIAALRRNRKLYETITLYDQNWNTVWTKDTSGTNKHHSLSTTFKENLQSSNAIVLSKIHFHKNGHLGVHLGHSINTNSSPKHFLIANLDLLAAFKPILANRTGLGKSGKAYLISTDGRYLAPKHERVNWDKNNSETFKVNSNQRTLEYRDYNGITVLGSSIRIPSLGCILVVEKDKKESFSWVSSLKKRVLITGTIVLTLVILFSLWSAKELASSFRQLAAIARRVGDGKHKERLKQMNSLEAQEVADAFNHMLNEIESEHQRLMHTASLAAIGELSSSIVHEMRNPLSTIKLNLAALNQKVKDDKDYAEIGQLACSQADRLEHMLNDLLAFGKPLNPKMHKISLVKLLEEAKELVLPESQAKKILLEKVVNITEKCSLKADYELLLRALINLLLNAIQAAPVNSIVRINAQISPEPDNNLLEITVKDQGVGIPDNIRERLFDPFFTTRNKGTGLGLANVKKIIEYHSGCVRVSSMIGGGATFTINLPLPEENA